MQAERATDADFVADEQDVELPEPQNGRRLIVRVRPIDAEALVAAMQGLPGLPAPEPEKRHGIRAGGGGMIEVQPPKADPLREVAIMRKVCELGVVSPSFTFGEQAEPGRPWWGMVRPLNRAAITTAIMQASGLLADGGPLGRFPDEPEGKESGAGAGRVEQAAAEHVAGSVGEA